MNRRGDLCNKWGLKFGGGQMCSLVKLYDVNEGASPKFLINRETPQCKYIYVLTQEGFVDEQTWCRFTARIGRRSVVSSKSEDRTSRLSSGFYLMP